MRSQPQVRPIMQTPLQRSRTIALTLAVPVALFCTAACSDDTGDASGAGGAHAAGGTGTVGEGGQSGAGGEGGSYNPPNPDGLGPMRVDLGEKTNLAAAAAYVLLGKTGLTNVTGSLISGGHVGLSPAAATFITGFSLTADPSSVFSTSASVVSPGKIYASNYTDPTPTNLTTAVLSAQAAYTDAAGRTNPDYLNLNSGDIGGQTLAPGLYRWGTSVTIPTDVTLAGEAMDVWVFQITNDLDLGTATNVLLSGGAQAQNIFWQVSGQVTLHADSHFEGVILSQTAITLQTNASLHGRALAQSLIALDDNAITAP